MSAISMYLKYIHTPSYKAMANFKLILPPNIDIKNAPKALYIQPFSTLHLFRLLITPSDLIQTQLNHAAITSPQIPLCQ